MKTAYILNQNAYFYNRDGGTRYQVEDLTNKGQEIPNQVDNKLYKISFDGNFWGKFWVEKVVELNIPKEIKSLEKRANNQRDYRVSDPGVMGRMEVQHRINGLKEAKAKYAQFVLEHVKDELGK